nr:uncharacterized protein LOC124815282 [Hydra vulgaris]
MRRFNVWKRNISHKKCNEGESYVDKKGIHHEKKQVRECIHNCRFKCNDRVSEQERQNIFKQYWELGSWELQSASLNSSIKVKEPRRKKKTGPRSKTLSCQFFFLDKRVCKKFFLCTLNVTNKQVTNVIDKKKNSTTGIAPRDKRGHKVPGNKICEEKIEFVKEHIRTFPKYTSHYSRTITHAPNRKYLSSNLNIKKLYNLYKESCIEHAVEPVKESYYRNIFNIEFNLSFHKPQTYTCITCDRLQNTIDNGPPDEQNNAVIQKELHLRKADLARQQITDAKEAVKDDASQLVICFDLQKMLPSPVLTCSKVYYSRQLWTYNFCVHNLGNDNASMFMWHEAQATRGCEEMLSCLLRLVSTLPTRVKKITMFSDNAGGQNKSRFTVKFWMYIVRTTHIEEVDHKYLLSGHSFNDCDRNFGTIERARRNIGTGIFVPEHWMDVTAKSSKRFLVVNMKDQDFISLQPLEDHYVKAVTGIRCMQWLKFKKSDPDTLFYKTTFNTDMPFSK